MKRANHQRQRQAAPVEQSVPLAVSVVDCARRIGVSRAFVYELIRRGDIRTFTLGKRRLVRIATLDAFLQERERATE